jgi:hypothetical protein
VSDFLFAISGAEAAYAEDHPLQKSKTNDDQPEWVESVKAPEPSPMPPEPTSGTMRMRAPRPGFEKHYKNAAAA